MMWLGVAARRTMGIPPSFPSSAVSSGEGIVYAPQGGLAHMFVPVVDQQQHPLMPTTPARARRWIQSGKATPFWKQGVFCVRLNVEPSDQEAQPIVVGIDPGSKKEGYSVVAAAHTYLNLQADAVEWVKDAVKHRRYRRRTGRRP